MPLPVEPMIPRELTERDGQEALHFAVEAAARSLKILEYQEQAGPARLVHEGFGLKFGQYTVTTDRNGVATIPFPTDFPENVACITYNIVSSVTQSTALQSLNASGFTIVTSLRNTEITVHFLAIGF